MPAGIPGEDLAVILQSGSDQIEDSAACSQGMAQGDQPTRTADLVVQRNAINLSFCRE